MANKNTMVKIFNDGLKNVDTNMLKVFTTSIANNFWEEDKIKNTLENTYALGYQGAKLEDYKEQVQTREFVERVNDYKLIEDVQSIAELTELFEKRLNYNLVIDKDLKHLIIQKIILLCTYLKETQDECSEE